MKERKAFTLIELLVVIAIIALLLAIIMPSLQKVKELASGVVCMSNQKQLALGWTMYASANRDRTVGGECLYKTVNGVPPWTMPPLDYEANGDIIEMGGSNAVTLEYRLNGLREGAMFTYLDDPDVYHCPADHRVARGTPNGSEAWYKIFRSYSMPTGMASNTTTQQRSSMGRFQPILKADDIRQPSSKYIFVEEVYDGYTTGANYNDKSWTFKPYGIGSSYLYELQDPLGQFHVKACTFAYADGHAGRYKFQDNETLKFWEDRLAYGGSNSNIGSFPGNLDCEWLADGFPYVR